MNSIRELFICPQHYNIWRRGRSLHVLSYFIINPTLHCTPVRIKEKLYRKEIVYAGFAYIRDHLGRIYYNHIHTHVNHIL